MNEKNTEYLFNKYPKLYAQKDLPNTVSLMGYGFPGDGWFDLIDELSSKLQDLCDQKGFQIEAVQVKSKWGGLRFYIAATDTEEIKEDDYQELRKIIGEAERLSFEICQFCGKEKDKNKHSHRCGDLMK